MQITVLRGRVEERRAIGRVLDGGGALVLHGEPGSGRTALVGHAHRRAEGHAVLAGTGLAEEAALPYAGLQRLLDPVLDRAGALPGPQARLLRRVLAGAGCPAGRRLALSLAVLRLLAAVSGERPLLCTMDDLDRGDRPTAETLAFVARRLRRLPVAVLLTTAAVPPAGLPSLRLRPLTERDSLALLADRLPEPPTPLVAAALIAVANGNPQALVDLADAVTPGQCRGDEPPPAEPPVDGVLGRAYRARLDQLPADTRRVLLLTALDEDGDPDTLVRAALAGGTTIAALAPAEVAGLVRVEAHRITFPQPVTRAVVASAAPVGDRRAAHLLLAGVLTDGGQRLRRAMHRAAAAAGPDPALAAELEEAVAAAVPAEHRPGLATDTAGEGGWAARASVALERAAELTDDPARAADRRLAAARYAWWAGSSKRARRLLAGLAAGPVPPPAAARAELLRGEVELRCGRVPAAVPTLRTAADTLAGADRQLALAALARAGEAACFSGEQYRYADLARRSRPLTRPGDPPATELIGAYLTGVAATLRGDHVRAGPALRRAVVLGGQLSGPALTPAGLAWAASAGLLVAVDGAAYRLADRAVELARARGERSALPRALELRAVAEYWLGRHEAAAETSREGLRTARATGQVNCADVHLGMLAVLAAVRADRDASLRRIREIGVEPAPGSRPHALAAWALAVLDLVDGRHEEAAARLASLARPGTGRGQILVQVMATPYLVEAAAHLAHRPAASAALAVFDRWASSTASPSRRALSARCHALLARRGSAAAEAGFRTALRLHPAEAGTFERARTALLFGRELRRGRRPRDARPHLHDAWGAFTLLGATAWAEQATAELRAAGESVGAPDPAAARLLTGQQMRIAQLIAEGATNREVAARMFLSTRTVDHHLRNIFHRLGVRSRTELARALT
ncbi:LuxR family transcriptional regulator [Micromonospora sp. WMMD812]|uniref:helix-turn-helix transcriptional regulator n=1 Tax=Micromonospora sp. WMMD812 TaxID=3015152 RepID=UPI00248CFBF8|nr:LuxR family transcriptional regulator [Micromonospora sp. WMMD812]WBB68029.1 LuxR C-terminal-related transcriptional regulator [Micromonospora sp. WMMD812]